MGSTPVLFPMGRSALQWVLKGGKPQRGSIGLRWSYRWQAFWFDNNLKAVDLKCSKAILRPPVFILGMWRSGTTFLHELLASYESLIAPTTWQCMNSSAHMLMPPPAGGQQVVRPMDSFSVGSESPQEDEFAMLAQGVPSVYLAFFDPRRLQELERWLDPQAWMDLPLENWWTRWRLFLMSVQQGHSGRLLLKSPNHTFRIRAILRNMPESSIVWMLRDPIDVFFSNMKMWKAMIQRYSLWEVDSDILDRQMRDFLIAALRRSGEELLYAAGEVGPEQLIVVRYDDVIERPAEILARITDRLAIGSGEADQDQLNRSIMQAGSFPRTTYKDRVVPEAVLKLRDELAATYAAVYATHGV